MMMGVAIESGPCGFCGSPCGRDETEPRCIDTRMSLGFPEITCGDCYDSLDRILQDLYKRKLKWASQRELD
jgi:hypothetical protein